MEYLVSYGWAILVIAIVLGSLFALGLFDTDMNVPRATAGSCQVSRPMGTGTTAYIGLVGVCDSEIPQYVARFNGQSSYIQTSGGYQAYSSITMSAWFYSSGPTGTYQFVIDSDPEAAWRLGFNSARQIFLDCGSHYDVSIPTTVNFNSWNFVAVTCQDSGTSNTISDVYLNGQAVSSGTQSGTITSVSNIVIGGYLTQYPFNGSIANVQIYNTALSQNDINALYLEGIGGIPLDIVHIVGWWPLNGDAVDYSGNGNDGAVTGVSFTSEWFDSYTAH